MAKLQKYFPPMKRSSQLRHFFVGPGLHVKSIACQVDGLKNVIDLQVQNIHTHPLYETIHHLMMFCTYK